jgi:hypothetical protein
MQSRVTPAYLAAKENNMHMIDVMKRLAALDAANPNVDTTKIVQTQTHSYVQESQQDLPSRPEPDMASLRALSGIKSLDECGMGGMMPEMGMSMAPEKPSIPASINMTAGSGDELSNMLATIMHLAGQKSADTVPAGPALDNIPPAAGTLEPAGGPMSQTDNMRSVIDKLNPMDDADSEEGDSDQPGGVGASLDRDGDGDHDMDDHDMEKKDKVDEYDNTPADPNDKDEFDANAHAHQENQPGQGDRMDGDRPKAYADMNEAVTDLFAQYKRFVSEN